MNAHLPLALAVCLLLGPAAAAQSNTNATAPEAASPATQTPAPGSAPEKKHAKHVYTDDDFSSPAGEDLPAGTQGDYNMAQTFLPKDPMTAKQLASLQNYVLAQVGNNRMQTKTQISKLYLRDDDVPFHGRDDWDNRMFGVWTDLWKAMEDFSQKLSAIRSQDAAVLTQSQLSPQDLAKLQEDRKQLIADWEPARKFSNRFIVLQHEASEKAAEYRKYNPR